MPNRMRSLPQAAADAVDSALGLVCNLPAAARNERRARVHDLIARATSSTELENGISFSFENSDDMAKSLLDVVLAERTCCAQFTYSIRFERQRSPIELRVEASGPLLPLLKGVFSHTRAPLASRPTMESSAQRLPMRLSVVVRSLGRRLLGW